jgi:23S rRNA pseudouridine1911/1915/1917 synthase
MVGSKDAGQRIDKFLCQKLPKLSRKQVKALLDGGRVSVGRHRVVIAGWELALGDSVEVRVPMGFYDRSEEVSEKEAAAHRASVKSVKAIPDSSKIGSSIDRFLERRKRRAASREQEREKERGEGRRGKRRKGREKRGAERGEEARLKVYHHDRDVIVVEKPAGILSIPKERSQARGTMKDLIRSYMKRKFRGARHSFIAPLHRLDAETSGIMVFALSKAGQKLTRQFKNHTIERSYQAVVAGRIEKENGVIKKPLEKGDFGHGKKVRPSNEGKAAVTEYVVKERYGHATLLEVRVRTGRTHQIRVHLASEGHPIIGDSLYADEAKAAATREIGFGRHALHAHSLAFKHPVNGNRVFHRSPLPKDMQDLIDALRESG